MKHRNIMMVFVVLVLLNAAGCITLFKTELEKAIIKGDITGTQLILKNGANINETDGKGITPLMYAICNQQTQMAKALVDWGADVNLQDKYGYSALLYAAWYENKEAVIFLLEKKADVKTKDKNGDTPLHIAVSLMNYEIIKLLIDKGADINAQNISGATSVHYASFYFKKNIKDTKLIIDCLLSKNPKTDIRDSVGWTALHYALYYKNIDIVAAIRKKTNWSERVWLDTPYAYYPEDGLYTVTDEDRRAFEYAVNDCSILMSNSQGLMYSENSFILCMDRMGFNANKFSKPGVDGAKSENVISSLLSKENERRIENK